MKTLYHLLLFTSLFAGTQHSIAQESKAIIIEPARFEKMRVNHNRYLDAYLFLLTPEERSILFKRNWKDSVLEKDAREGEARFQKRLREVEMMTALQRDSILGSTKLSKDETMQVKLVKFEKSVILQIYNFTNSRDSKKYMEMLELFEGYPVYVVTYQRKWPDGQSYTSYISIVFQKTLDKLTGIGFNKAL